MVFWSVVVYAFMWWYYSWENARRAAGNYDADFADLIEEEMAELGDKNPKFRYTI